ncbi:hypothetical protein M0812_21895 [Anaeramoeba flamelloides]|uniref:Vacuolar protein sorting 55 n=1 Tax=Anaeramoeba flamelloides TaxID=1746091 RepID=A0AAV7YW21_9EUKA|nr:hypothetical protein M0812_21895 [Anaeramoeba flamelloides]|eukprot:Anaeramoba_flamelloidesc40953_g1_i2.p1 GENE.c40953_g1_i2~~c40953_g1_i2.p1  ORF type:complete len:135 (-),score=8.88 c40953_g1_i2:199-603(-)
MALSSTKKLIILAGILAVGIFMNIIACSVYHNALPLVAIVFYLLAPLSMMFCKGQATDFTSAPGFGSAELSNFFTGIFLMSGIFFPIVLVHVGVIEGAACALTLIGGVIVIVACIFVQRVFSPPDDLDTNYTEF